ncbi:hypothetical protein [Thalassovita taeanensis]|uniref:Uncharacterized protein n=1 Tax=Thalassovita taeanensis TaxID=657014 RepID=A0A1H9JBH5_9RHOB|nr:hypothetical protein [Thalassovita taeanensis]SEQ84133.1 hypothetical protein SAMN04488092_11489 [Thalassovita taeanensis]
MDHIAVLHALHAWGTADREQRNALLIQMGVPAEKLRNAPDYYDSCMDMCAEKEMEATNACLEKFGDDDEKLLKCAEKVTKRLTRCYEGCDKMLEGD